MDQPRSLSLVLGIVCSLSSSCQLEVGPDPSGSPVEEAPLQEPSHPATIALHEERTTDDSFTFIKNRDGSIATLREQLVNYPTRHSDREALVRLLVARAREQGSYDDFTEAGTLSADGLELAPKRYQTYSTRASYLSAVHQFEQSLNALDWAEKYGAPDFEVERRRITVELALGHDPEPLVRRAAALVERGDFYELHYAHALTLSANGQFLDADKAYQRAISALRDPSPMPMANVQFARGVMWSEAAGRPNLGRILYEDAVRRVPEFAVANVHLAELEIERGDDETAEKRLRGFLGSGDPEPAGALAELLRESDESSARALHAEAVERYDELLSRHRNAFLDHAAEFHRTQNPALSLALAQENLDLRQDPPAFTVAIESANEAGDLEILCELMVQARNASERTPTLHQLIAETSNQCSNERPTR